MPQTSKVRYYDSRAAYYTKYKGKQYLLASGPKDEPDGPTYKLACIKWGQLMSGQRPCESLNDTTLGIVISSHVFRLSAAAKDDPRKAEALRSARTFLDPIEATFGQTRVCDLRRGSLYDWIASQTTWGATTKAMAVGKLQAVLNRAIEDGTITDHPLRRLKDAPRVQARGAGYVLHRELAELVFNLAGDALARILRFLHATGARPGEALNAQAKHYRPELHAIVFPANPPSGEWAWKCARHGKQRVIFLPPELEPFIAEQAKARPSGYLFVTHRGKRWSDRHFPTSVRRTRQRPAVVAWCKAHNADARCVLPYAFRHTFMTERLAQGCPIKVLADLCGTSVRVIERHYGHVHDDLPAMYRLFLLFASRLAPAAV